MSDDFDLQRFVDAQEAAGTYAQALRELRGGRKRSHWIWFVFPQIAGLGFSQTSQHFAISGLAEARAYLAHPTLGARLVECAEVLLELQEDDAERLFGSVDAQKLQSSMTLFGAADAEQPAFHGVLDKFFAGQPDSGTTSRL